jgi:uncharacterized membrane protein
MQNLLLVIQKVLINNQKTAKIILILMYIAGFIGLQNEITKPIFLKLTSFNLWVSAFLLLLFHENLSEKAALSFGFVFILGYLVEVLGVKTGVVFGQYAYGNSLGTKILDVPIAIGANWLVLCYCFTYFFKKLFFQNIYLIALLSSICMVLLDYLIEPVAIKLDFWQWANNQIPYQNYLGWFLLAFLLNLYLLKQKVFFKNNIAQLLLGLQILFFALHNLFFIFR